VRAATEAHYDRVTLDELEEIQRQESEAAAAA